MVYRHDPQKFDIRTPAAEPIPELEFTSEAHCQIVGRDADSHAVTALMGVPAGFGASVSAAGALELFVLEGALELAGRVLSTGGYAYVPEAVGALECRSPAGASALLFWRPDPVQRLRDTVVIDTWAAPWEMTVLDGFPAGALHKSLRPGDRAGARAHGGDDGFLRLVHSAPGWTSALEERHVDCWEENILLHGDMLMPGRGVLAPGDVLANPRDHWHGPMVTKTGTLFIVNCDVPMPVEYRPYPPGERELREYLDTAPWS